MSARKIAPLEGIGKDTSPGKASSEADNAYLIRDVEDPSGRAAAEYKERRNKALRQQRKAGLSEAVNPLQANNSYEPAGPNRKYDPGIPAAIAVADDFDRAFTGQHKYKYEGLDEGYEESPWIQPSVARALREARVEKFDRGLGSVCANSVSDLFVAGPQVGLFFVLLQRLMWLFLWMGIVSVPLLILAYDTDSLQDHDDLRISVLTIGNLGRSQPTAYRNLANVTQTGEAQNNFYFVGDGSVDTYWGISMSGPEVALLVTAIDIVAMLAFLVAFVLLPRAIRSRQTNYDDNAVRASDYAVYVEGLPADATSTEIMNHFSSLYQLTNPDWEFEGYCFGRCWRKRARNSQDLQECIDVVEGRSAMLSHPPDPCRPVVDVSNTNDDTYLGSWVGEVSLATKDGKAIRTYFKQQKLEYLLRRQRARAKMHAADTPNQRLVNSKKKLKAVKKVEKLSRKMRKLQSKLVGSSDDAVGAFVLFNHEESFLRCVEDYEGSGGCCHRMWQPVPLRFRSVVPLKIRAAAPPNDILWENVDAGCCAKFWYRLRTVLVLVLLFAVALMGLHYANNRAAWISDVTPDKNACWHHMPAVQYGQYLATPISESAVSGRTSPSEATIRIVRGPSNACERPDTSAYLSYEFPTRPVPAPVDDQAELIPPAENWRYDNTLLVSRGVYSSAQESNESIALCPGQYPPTNQTCIPAVTFDNPLLRLPVEPCGRPCVAVESDGGVYTDTVYTRRVQELYANECPAPVCLDSRWEGLGYQCESDSSGARASYRTGELLNCFCQQEMEALAGDWMGFEVVAFVLFAAKVADHSDICHTYSLHWGVLTYMPYAGAVLVIVINLLLPPLTRCLVYSEKRLFRPDRELAYSRTVFGAQFFNTVVLTLLAFMKLPNGYHSDLPWRDVGFGIGPLFNNKFDTFSSGWYRDVAPLIVIIIVLSALLPICGRQCNHCCCRRCKQRCCRNKKVMQQDLDKLYAGKEWRIAGWYGHLNFVAAACIALSAGIPVLLPLGGLLFLYTYWSMKCLFLRYYRRPPLGMSELAQQAVKVAVFGLIVHIALAVWMLGEILVLNSDDLDLSRAFIFSDREASSEWLSDIQSSLNTGGYDPLGVFEHITRENTAPLLAFFIALIVVALVMLLFGRAAIFCIRKSCFYLTCKRCCRVIKDYDGRKYLPPYTNAFLREMNPLYEHSLNEQSVEGGWILESQADGRQILSKVWLDQRVIDGVPHDAGDRKRTWEVIRDSELYSYRLEKNPAYAGAVAAKHRMATMTVI